MGSPFHLTNKRSGGICIHGTFCITGNGINDYGEQDSCSLTNEQISKYTDRFSKNMLITPMSLINGEIDQIMDDSEDMTMMMMEEAAKHEYKGQIQKKSSRMLSEV